MEEIIGRLRSARTKTELLLLKKEIKSELKELEARKLELESKESEFSEKEIEKASLVEFNSQSYASFYTTRLEKDKSILTLSVAGLGFIITFLNVIPSLHWAYYPVFGITALFYLVSIFSIIKIFDKNADYISAVTMDDPIHESHEVVLKKLDQRALVSFLLAILISFVIGMAVSINKKIEFDTMSNKETNSKVQVGTESLEGAAKMKPGVKLKNESSDNKNGEKK